MCNLKERKKEVGFGVGGEEDGPMGAPDTEQFIGGEEEFDVWETTIVVTALLLILRLILLFHVCFAFTTTHHLYDS